MSAPSSKAPPRWSSHLYVRIDPSKVHMFRFLLEAQDNLGYMSVVDRWAAALQVTFAPQQEREMRAFLAGMRQSLEFELLDINASLKEPA